MFERFPEEVNLPVRVVAALLERNQVLTSVVVTFLFSPCKAGIIYSLASMEISYPVQSTEIATIFRNSSGCYKIMHKTTNAVAKLSTVSLFIAVSVTSFIFSCVCKCT